MRIGDHKIDLDLKGTLCPMTFVKLRVHMDALPGGTVFTVAYDASPANATVPASVEGLGHTILVNRAIDEGGDQPVTLLHIVVGG